MQNIAVKQKDASNLRWSLLGWRPFHWRLRKSMELGAELKADVSPIPVTIPSSVQGALRKAGIIPDWNAGMQSRDCEWVEHRHWEFVSEIPEGFFDGQKTIQLVANGLDYSGWLLVDGTEVAAFSGALVPHIFDLDGKLCDGKKHYLSIIFDKPPDEQGQIGYTSRSRYFKPRFNYGWDWCPRFAHIGICDKLYFETGIKSVDVECVRTFLNSNNLTGRLHVILKENVPADNVVLRLIQHGKLLWEKQETLTPGRNEFNYDGITVDAWWPNGMGAQPIYDFEIAVKTGSQISQIQKYQVGFKRVEWESCEGAPENALPWICRVNGNAVFLQGVNWTPIAMDYTSISEEAYRHRIRLYKEMGCNLLRVWGGAYLEKEIFYQLCDEAGLMVWQEFPLSSSGIDNLAPENPESIRKICDIAKSYIRRRGHHVSKLLWCGGNELQDTIADECGFGVPLNFTNPCLKALLDVVKQEDTGVRMLPTSSSGPKFAARADDFGKGVHHDVHGPWTMDGPIEQWEAYWNSDDALLRSETGLPGASSVELIYRYCGGSNPWPPTAGNPYWLHSNAWWIQWDVLKEQLRGSTETEKYASYVKLSQELQARGLAIAAGSCKSRFPRCGGFILWMGHDAFPCLANTSIIDFDGNPKPAYYAVKKVFRG